MSTYSTVKQFCKSHHTQERSLHLIDDLPNGEARQRSNQVYEEQWMFQPAETRHPPLEAHLRKAKALDCSHATQSYATAVRTRLPETDAMRLHSASRAELAARLATPPAGHGESCPLTRQLSQLSWKIYTRESIERASESFEPMIGVTHWGICWRGL